MNSVVPDILSINVVFAGVELMNKPESGDNLARAASSDILTELVGMPPSSASSTLPSPRRYILQRDRISVDVDIARTSIQREFPSPPPSDDFARLAYVTTVVLDNTDFEEQQLSAYGYNMVIVFDPGWQEPTIQYLGEHLFSTDVFTMDDWTNTGGYGSLVFTDDDERKWTFLLEPRPRDDVASKKLYMTVNQHIADTRLPMQESINSALNESLRRSTYLVEQLLRVGT